MLTWRTGLKRLFTTSIPLVKQRESPAPSQRPGYYKRTGDGGGGGRGRVKKERSGQTTQTDSARQVISIHEDLHKNHNCVPSSVLGTLKEATTCTSQ